MDEVEEIHHAMRIRSMLFTYFWQDGVEPARAIETCVVVHTLDKSRDDEYFCNRTYSSYLASYGNLASMVAVVASITTLLTPVVDMPVVVLVNMPMVSVTHMGVFTGSRRTSFLIHDFVVVHISPISSQ